MNDEYFVGCSALASSTSMSRDYGFLIFIPQTLKSAKDVSDITRSGAQTLARRPRREDGGQADAPDDNGCPCLGAVSRNTAPRQGQTLINVVPNGAGERSSQFRRGLASRVRPAWAFHSLARRVKSSLLETENR